jgi:broad specificity phosphatase PhoE
MIDVVFETHSLSEDNEAGLASGWNHSRLSEKGRELARLLGERRRNESFSAVFCSDLRRAVETAEIAFGATAKPILHDWRLRECDFGEMNGTAHRERAPFLDRPYPRGETWREAIERVGRALDDLSLRWDGGSILIIGHVATRWALEHYTHGVALEELVTIDFEWRQGWKYRLETPRVRAADR